MNVVVNGLMANYQKSGSGKTILMLPGWGDDGRTFEQLAPLLADKCQVVILDLPGFGGTQMPESAWSLENYADFVDQFLKKTNLKPYALVAHSYGGAVAILELSRHKVAARLILLGSAGIRNKRPVRKKLLAGSAKIGKLPLILLPDHKRQVVKAKLYGSIGSDILVAPHMEQTFRKIINEDVSEQATHINIPTLLIYGSQDKVTPVKDGHIINRAIRGSRLEIINAGHFLHQEEPQRVAQLIIKFLKQDAKNA